MKVKLNRKVWSVRFVDGMEDYGGIDDPSEKNKEIRIRTGMTQLRELDTVIHECLHGTGFDHFAEEWVTTSATSIAGLLYEMGWRKHGDSDNVCSRKFTKPVFVDHGIGI